MKRRGNPEADIQREIVKVLRLALPPGWIVHHSANERRSQREQAILVGMGVHPGFSDLTVLGPGHVLFLEVKTSVGRQSPAQREFESAVKAMGFAYEVVRSPIEVIQALHAHGIPCRVRL